MKIVSLVDKLGIKQNFRIAFLNTPDGYLKMLRVLPKDVEVNSRLVGKFDFIQYFAKSKKDLEKIFLKLKKHLSKDGMLWICWPKKGSETHGDLDENKVIKVGLANGLVDVKVCSIDKDWSGLKFVYRVKDRI